MTHHADPAEARTVTDHELSIRDKSSSASGSSLREAGGPGEGERQDAAKLLRLLIGNCDGADEHSWRRCKRCVAFHLLQNGDPFSVELVEAAVTCLNSHAALTAQRDALQEALLAQRNPGICGDGTSWREEGADPMCWCPYNAGFGDTHSDECLQAKAALRLVAGQ